MKHLSKIISELKTQLKKLENNEGKSLLEIHTPLKSCLEFSKNFEDAWAGAWGQENFDYYTDPKRPDYVIQRNNEYFYKALESAFRIDIHSTDKKIFVLLGPYKKFVQHLVTELSVIRDKEGFANENELLKAIETFRWGTEINDYIKVRRPNNIIIYDPTILNKGLDTPPHIFVIGHIFSSATKSFSIQSFSELAIRLLRQIELKIDNKSMQSDAGYTEKILTDIFDNFHFFYTQLRNRYDKRISIEIIDEYDVQDLLHAILKLHFKDVRTEEYTPSYAGSSTRMDILLKSENIVIEVKKTREKLSDKEIGQQLILDASYYKNHPNCNLLICFVYDPQNRVKNPRGLESDLDKLSDEKLAVKVSIRP